MRRTFVADASMFNLQGEVLVTIYDNTVTLALREFGERTWGPPVIAIERP